MTIGGTGRQLVITQLHDFAIEEGGVKQTVVYFAGGESPLSFSLSFDISDSEPLKLMAQQAAWGFVKQIRSTDEVVIPQLRAGRDTVRDFAADKGKLEKALNGIFSNNKSSLVSLIPEAIKSTNEKRRALRNFIVVITDGLGLSGTAADREAANQVLRENTPTYFIILDDGRHGSRRANPSRVRRTRDLLFRVAEVSGGQAVVVKNANDISVATEQIIHRVNNQYMLAYYPTNDKFDGLFRYLSVTVKPKDMRKVKVFAPLGYYAPDITKSREEKTDDK
jgi:VWFA-related protein